MDTFGRDRVGLRDIKHILDSGDSRVIITFGIFAQQFTGDESTIRCHADQISESATPINPESPACINSSHLTVSKALVSKSVD
jgi:hypothetical protein